MSHQQTANVMVVMPNEARNAVTISFAHSRYDTNLFPVGPCRMALSAGSACDTTG